LRIYRDLAEENPSTYLPNVAGTLNNLALLHSDKNELTLAQGEYEEALRIYRDLAEENPSTYLPDVAMTLLNLSIFYLQAKSEKEKSTALANETIEIARHFQQLPTMQRCAKTAIEILQANQTNDSASPQQKIAPRSTWKRDLNRFGLLLLRIAVLPVNWLWRSIKRLVNFIRA
jgi:tetratricopeptide (TPR) repeat protein